LGPRSERALALAPHATRWAHRFVGGMRRSPRAFRRHAAPTIVHMSVQGIAWACIDAPDDVLRELLVGAIADCRALVDRSAPTLAVTEDRGPLRLPRRERRRVA